MPIFISYSHADREFVEDLATQLVVHKVNVWLDRWEMHVGESLIDRIQAAITDASALLVILSPDSVASEWCKKELNSGLIRELEERRIVILPVLVKDCGIPIFLREKLYADFRSDSDEGLRTILEAIAKVTNEWQNRLEEPTWHTDWSIDWFKSESGLNVLRLTLVEVAQAQPYSTLTTIGILPAEPGANRWLGKVTKTKKADEARRHIIESLSRKLTEQDIRVLLEDQFEKTTHLTFDSDHGEFIADIRTRWLGTDTGRDVLFNTAHQVEGITRQMQLAAAKGSDDARNKRLGPPPAAVPSAKRRHRSGRRASLDVVRRRNISLGYSTLAG